MTIQIELRVKQFLTDRLSVKFGGDVDDSSDLFALGLLDSKSYVQLIRFIETEFDLKLTDEQMLSDSLASVGGIVAMVQSILDERVS